MTQTPKKQNREERYIMMFVEQGFYNPVAKTHRGGRIEIYPIGDYRKEIAEEIGLIKLPKDVWVRLRKKLDNTTF